MKHMILAMCAGLGLATIAAAGMRVDRFCTRSPEPMWRADVDVIEVRENGRLQFRSNETQGGEHATLYEARRWRFDFTRSYKIDVQYRLDPGQVTGNRYAAVGMIIEPRGQIDEIVVMVRRDAGGLALFIEVTKSNDVVVQRRVPINTSQGILSVRYRGNADRLDVFVDGALTTRVFDVIDGVDTDDRRAKLSIGASRRGNQFWDWGDAWLDKFMIKGRIFD